MDIITHVTQWVNGEVLQGKITIGLSILFTIAFLYFSDLQQSFYKGLAIPIILFQLVLLGYGAYQVTQRPTHIEKVSQGLRTQPQETLKAELTKAQKDDKTYSMVKIVWIAMVIILGALFFVINSDFWKGSSLGFALFFIGMFIFDGFLHQRLKTYLLAIESIILN
jgi:hypothetical protein